MMREPPLFVMGLVILVLLLFAAAVRNSGAEGSPLAQGARTLAENVLGRGTVVSIRVSPNGSMVALRWDAASYTSRYTREINRELLYTEAVLATGAVLGRLAGVQRISFTMVKGDQVLAAGVVTRAQGVWMAFAPPLGGGVYTPAETEPRIYTPGADDPAQPL